jgi:hypothetical protein
MKTFGDFIDEQNLDSKLIETATLMVVKDVEPVAFLQDWYQHNHPEASVLLEGLWDNVKNAGSQMWQGVKQGAKQFAADQFGPQAKFNQAIKALTSLVQYMQNEPSLKAMQGTTGPLMNQINGINKQLGQLRDYMPQMQSQTTGNWGQPNRPGSQTLPIGQGNGWPSNMGNAAPAAPTGAAAWPSNMRTA